MHRLLLLCIVGQRSFAVRGKLEASAWGKEVMTSTSQFFLEHSLLLLELFSKR